MNALKPCPVCGDSRDDAEYVPVGDVGSKPSAGELLICSNCELWLILNEDGSQRQLTKEEQLAIPPDRLYKMLAAKQMVQRMKREMARDGFDW